MNESNTSLSLERARAAFERDVAKLYDHPAAMDTKVVSDPALGVPGFTTFEAFHGKHSNRGWARDDGTTVLARRVNFGPVLEALGFRDDQRSPSARALAECLAWMHGPFYTLVDEVAEGECGADETLYVEPERDSQDDGRVEFRFAPKMKEPPTDVVIQYRVFGHPDGSYKIDIYQLAPPSDEPDIPEEEPPSPGHQNDPVTEKAQTVDYRIRWFSIFTFPDRADGGRWYKGPQGIAAAIDLLAATSLWPELQVFGSDFKVGKPLIESLDTIKQRVASGPDVYVFARGAPRAALYTNEAEIAIEIDLSPFQVELKIALGGGALDRLGARFLNEVTDVFVQLLNLWRGKTYLTQCAAVPFAEPEFVYPRPRPPRVSTHHRWINAIVDIVQIDPVPTGAYPIAVAESRAIAAATPPASVVRSEQAGAVILRWTEDPRDVNDVALAIGRHEAWISGLIETEPAYGWNERGDRQVIVSNGIHQPPFRVVNLTTGIGYFEVAAQPAGLVTVEDWAQVEALANALPDGVRELALVVPTRDAALALAERARSLGINQLVYVQDKSLWDPNPPGPWLASEA